MKKTRTTRFALVLLLALSPAVRTTSGQHARTVQPTLKQITLAFELQELPGGSAAGSFWEVSYQWRIADQPDFNRWASAGEDPVRQNSIGLLLSKQSFTRRNLSTPESRRFSISVPVKGELLRRLQNAKQRPQIVWLDATVRIHDAKFGTEVIKKVNPVWGPYFYREGIATLRMELTHDGDFRWYTGNAPPWARERQEGVSSRIPSP